jgi:hypothetical protein
MNTNCNNCSRNYLALKHPGVTSDYAIFTSNAGPLSIYYGEEEVFTCTVLY